MTKNPNSKHFQHVIVAIHSIPRARCHALGFFIPFDFWNKSWRIFSNRFFIIFNTPGGAYWSIVLEYAADEKSDHAPSRFQKKIDYKEVLSPDDFQIFSQLRKWRNDLAKQNGFPIYNIFDNEQIATMARKRIASREGLMKIKGVGDARVQKYGDIGIINMSGTTWKGAGMRMNWSVTCNRCLNSPGAAIHCASAAW